MKNIFKDFIREEKGQTLVEWIMILALILIVVLGALKLIGEVSEKRATNIKDEIENPSSP